jgi:hypothetical protein
MLRLKLNSTLLGWSLPCLLFLISGELDAQTSPKEIELRKHQTLNLPGLVMKYSIPKEFDKRRDLQNKVLERLTEYDIRSPKRLLENVDTINRGTDGPIGKGYKSCFLRLGKSVRLTPKTSIETIEQCSGRLSMSIGKRNIFEGPLKSLDNLYQNAPTHPEIEYAIIKFGNEKLMRVRKKGAGTLDIPIDYKSTDNTNNTQYFYKVLDKDTYLEIAYEGLINEQDISVLLLSIVNSIELEPQDLKSYSQGDGNQKLVDLINENRAYPTGSGGRKKLGEKIFVDDAPESYRGAYFLESGKINIKLDENDSIITSPSYTYRKRTKDLKKLEDKVLIITYSGAETLPNLDTIELKSLFKDGRIDQSSTLNRPFTLIYTDESGNNLGIMINKGKPMDPPPTN